MSKMNLRELFHIETKNEWLPPFYESQDEIDAETAFSNWLIVRDTKQAEEIEKMVKHSDWLNSGWVKALGECNKLQRRIDESVYWAYERDGTAWVHRIKDDGKQVTQRWLVEKCEDYFMVDIKDYLHLHLTDEPKRVALVERGRPCRIGGR